MLLRTTGSGNQPGRLYYPQPRGIREAYKMVIGCADLPAQTFYTKGILPRILEHQSYTSVLYHIADQHLEISSVVKTM